MELTRFSSTAAILLELIRPNYSGQAILAKLFWPTYFGQAIRAKLFGLRSAGFTGSI